MQFFVPLASTIYMEDSQGQVMLNHVSRVTFTVHLIHGKSGPLSPYG